MMINMPSDQPSCALVCQAARKWRYKNPLETWIARHFGIKTQIVNQELVRQSQWQAFKELLAWVGEKSPFYKKKLAGISTASFAEIDKIPLTSTDELRSGWKRFLCVSQSHIERMVTINESSGTLGLPKRLAFCSDDIESVIDYFQAGMSHMVEAGDRVLILMPGGDRPYTVSSLFVEAMPRLKARGHASGADIVQEIKNYQPHVLVAMPQQLQNLMDSFTESPSGNLRAILSSAAFIGRDFSIKLMQRWNAALLDHYASTETAYCGAVACGPMADYHINEWDLYLEIIDPITLKVVPDGIYGEIVVSTLQRRAMPLVRYRSGDVAAIETEPCTLCGSLLRRLKPIEGRLQFTSEKNWTTHHPPKHNLGRAGRLSYNL